MRGILFVLLITICILQSNAQNRFSNWFFANGVGIKFVNSGPVLIGGGQTASEEGVASISDQCGNLLFYSDGMSVWNRKHNLMINGSGLKGDNQSSEAVLIVPLPLSDSLYYIFTTGSFANNDGVQYSIVDMSLQSGDGQVIAKNNQLYSKCSEKLAAVIHSNKKDYWIITHDWDNSSYKVYLLTEDGLNPTPVVSVLGPTTNSSTQNAVGHLRPSPDGTLVANTFWNQNTLEIYNFNNSSGGLSLKSSLTNFTHGKPFSVEFSPNNKILYSGEVTGAANNDIYQYDLTSSNISGSQFKITTSNDRLGNFSIAPDGKIYLAKYNQNYLAVISNPNTLGSGANYISNGFDLGAQKSKQGLPNPIHPIVVSNPEYAISAIPGCKLSDPVKFELLSNFCYDSLVWDLSDFSSSDNFSHKKKLSHVYPYRGNYDITLTVYLNAKAYTLNKNVKVPANPDINLGRDTLICGPMMYYLDAGNPGGSYLWQDNYTGKARNITLPGKYYVTVTLGRCVGSDTIVLKNTPLLSLGKDTGDCFKNSLTYSNSTPDSIIWENGLNTKTRMFIAPAGTYTAKVHFGKCVKTDTIMIFLPELYDSLLPKDTTLCEGQTIVINAPNTAIKYLWNDGSSVGSRIIDKTGFYELVQSGRNCLSKQNFNLKVANKFTLPKFQDTTICFGEKFRFSTDLKNAVFKINGKLTKGDNHIFDTIGFYFLKAENECFKDSTSFNLAMDSCPITEVIFPEIFSPNGDLLNETFNPIILGDPSKISNYDFRIYNRWGQQVFGSQKPGLGWDGNFIKNPCQSGHYFWTCNLKISRFDELTSHQLKGLIFLIR